ncbi:MAG: hypothetical protein A3F74_22045 [Betaproteobacteria bacterium RIFCSPLOWO2_12_FULL_62_58]|nr:MAG: hypothetical protein A3F74_22045 [Betaproteobacteria bacterium RIFCSPLOWO2_12_FULL_62_58]
MKYEPPEFKKAAFTCPHCDVYASFWWKEAKEDVRFSSGAHGYQANDLHIATCTHCRGRVVWFVNENNSYMLWPFGMANAPLPHEDMPEDVKADYLEARNICQLSPRGAAALLRLAIQKLCKHLGETGENINADIGSLVKKGLPVQIQQALDVVRVTGNNAVHPGELLVDDNPEIVSALFGLINLIIDNRIAEPKRIAALYVSLPEGALRGIEKRDG